MIQIDKYSKKYKIALERRKSPQFVSMLDSELKGSEWVEQLAACQLSLDNITKAADFETKEDGLIIHGNAQLKAATAFSYDDHRIAMSLAILGTAGNGVEIENPACVNISDPEFYQTLEEVQK